MTRLDWEDLPDPVRAAVQDRCGAVVKAETSTSGIMPGVAARLHTEHGSVFLKAINADNTAAFLHIREQWASHALPAAVERPGRRLARDGLRVSRRLWRSSTRRRRA
ncbi:hypothetical protein [Nonomuraea dietziae]|uniref:hypothetical protein n=1 Tax=Nonomuraea dietziae TaxID=65515 RepID=UPI0033E929BB